MDGTLHFKFKGPLPSGFILQKDVHTSNLLFSKEQIPIKKISKILPFRPPTGRIPQDPTPCVKIIKLSGLFSLNTEDESIYLTKLTKKNIFSPKKLKICKLKYTSPKNKLKPISGNDFYLHLRKKGLRIKYIDDDLNITSNNGRKIVYTFKEDYYLPKFDVQEKINKKNILKVRNEYETENYNNYFDYGFHSKKTENNLNNRINSERIYKNKNTATQKGINLFNKKFFSKDNTFQTQIDFNSLDKYKKKNRALTARIKSNIRSPFNN